MLLTEGSMHVNSGQLSLAAGALLLPALAATQVPPASRTTEDALLREVRLLRIAIERQGTVNGRAQVLMARLGVQDQRVGRAMATFERAQAEAASAAQRLAQMRREHARLRRVVEETADAAARTAFEQKMQDLQRQMAEHGHPPPDPQMRLGEARHALDTERARFDELEAALERLDRELEPPVR
jgi:hypothetical protein